jgi:salicylate hydroxylase
MNKAIEAIGQYQAMNQHNHIGPNAHLLHYPVANNTMLNATAFVTDTNDWPDDKQQVTQGSFQDLENAFNGWEAGVRNLITLFPKELDKWAVFDTWDYPAPFYNRGNICLAGDAAHASSPHHGAGACMGIEDALCLCTVVKQAYADIKDNSKAAKSALSAAFSVYDSVRRTRSQWLVNSSRRVCDLYQQPEWADDSKLVKAETCFEEIRDRSLKIWNFDYDAMVEEAVRGYRMRREEHNGVATLA